MFFCCSDWETVKIAENPIHPKNVLKFSADENFSDSDDVLPPSKPLVGNKRKAKMAFKAALSP